MNLFTLLLWLVPSIIGFAGGVQLVVSTSADVRALTEAGINGTRRYAARSNRKLAYLATAVELVIMSIGIFALATIDPSFPLTLRSLLIRLALVTISLLVSAIIIVTWRTRWVLGRTRRGEPSIKR